MDRSSPAGGRRARVVLAIAAVVVVVAIVGLAGYVRSAAKGSEQPAAGPDDRGAPAERTPAGPAARSPSARGPGVPDARGGSRDGAGAAPALPDAPLAEDRFLGDQGAPTPPPASGAARPPDPPSEPTDPEPTVADDPRDFELPPGQTQ